MNKVNVSQHSLTHRLLIYLLIPVVLIICFAGAIAIVVASRSINTLYDRQLQNNAEILLALLHYEYSEEQDDYEEDENRDSEKLGDELVEIVTNIEANQDLSVSYRISI
jgi:membrane protein implicated in regulation of membrane protease activity